MGIVWRHSRVLFSLGLVLVAGGCQSASLAQNHAATQPRHVLADVAPAELRDILAGMSRSHGQKIELAFWVGTPLMPVTAPFKPFFSTMGTTQALLQGMLRAWAREQGVDLTYSFTRDTLGQAQKIMEDRQEKLIRADAQADFQRDILMQMYTDYEWQISQIQALLPKVSDSGLKAYLEKSLQVHEDGSKEIVRLLRDYKFVPQ
jgi:hypothetical protein